MLSFTCSNAVQWAGLEIFNGPILAPGFYV